MQDEFNRLYNLMSVLLDVYYPEQTVTITSEDPPYVTPAVKRMMRRKNTLIRLGRCEEAAALAVKIGAAIKNFNSAELSRVDVLSNPRSLWSKVRQLTGRSKTSTAVSQNSGITANGLNDHYTAISNDSNYTPPCVKATANNWDQAIHITKWRLFDVLDSLRPTSMGLDKIPA